MPRPPRRPGVPARRRGQQGARFRLAHVAHVNRGSTIVAATGRPPPPPPPPACHWTYRGRPKGAHRVQNPAARPGARRWGCRDKPQREEDGGTKEAHQRHGHGYACRRERDGGEDVVLMPEVALVCPAHLAVAPRNSMQRGKHVRKLRYVVLFDGRKRTKSGADPLMNWPRIQYPVPAPRRCVWPCLRRPRRPRGGGHHGQRDTSHAGGSFPCFHRSPSRACYVHSRSACALRSCLPASPRQDSTGTVRYGGW